MKINVITLMPEMIETAMSYGVVGSAFKIGLCYLETINPRQFTEDNHQTVDDRPFGGGDGMLMMAEPLQKAIDSLPNPGTVFYLSPQGKVFDDESATQLASFQNVTMICGRYGGVDNRFLIKNNIQEVSIGNFVLSGGEPAAIAIMDSVVRKIPGVLGHESSASQDSFANGLLEMPHFTRPQNWKEIGVPSVLLSGDHKKIHEYKVYMNVVTTLVKRPELLNRVKVTWSDAYSFLEKLEDENWQGTGFVKKDVLSKVKDLL